MQKSLESLIEAQRVDYDANFSHVEHEIVCEEPPSATIRLHFVKADASGEPRFRELATPSSVRVPRAPANLRLLK